MTFKSDILGEFSETFRFALEGSSEMLTLTFKGHVVAPTFKFSDEIIDFGRVSYKFAEQKTVRLQNTSEVDIVYVIRVPGDERQQFSISNDRGSLEKGCEAEIVIEFVPVNQQQYDMVLVVDLEGVGQDMLAVPIKADCKVPRVRISPSDYLDYETCFLKHPKSRQIEIFNEDADLMAKFEVLPQDEQSKRIALYTADEVSGVIEGGSRQVINVSLRTEILTKVHINLYIKVEGHQIPFMVTINATSRGPQVVADRTEIDYQSVKVLEDVSRHLTIRNKSKIPAEYTAFTKDKQSIWKVIQRYGKLEPDEERQIEVVCNADEIQKFTDTLHIIINNGHDLEVLLRARGVGSTLYCKNNLDTIDFGTKYTHSSATQEFFLENRGRKVMNIEWVKQTKMQRKDKKVQDDKSQAKKTTGSAAESGQGAAESKEEEDAKQVYHVTPLKIQLQPKHGYRVQFKAISQNIGEVKEDWQCQVTLTGERKAKVAFASKVVSQFIYPSLNFSEPKLWFKYLWEKGVASMPIQKTLSISNAGPLPTTVTLKVEAPFSCTTERLTLTDGAPDQVQIDFDPGMKQDRLSDKITGKLMISHHSHASHKDYVQLEGEVCFPNLQIVPPNIDFGCILNDTNKRKYLVLTNISEMPVNYEWSFLEEEQPMLNAVLEEDEGRKRKKRAKAQPINEVFDILPVSGRLEPGQVENVEFTFQAGHGLLYSGVAVCSVDGGPDYEVPILGESSFVDFRLSATNLDYGHVNFMEPTTDYFWIENIGKVPFEFNINLGTLSRPGIVTCGTMSGKVLAGDKFKVGVTLYPGVPDNIQEMILVECGHFPAVRFTVKAVGIYPGCLLSFPRLEDSEYSERLESTRAASELGQITYSAPFSGPEAVKNMPAIPQKMVDKQKVAIKDPAGMQIEAETDRGLLCDKIIGLFNQSMTSGVMSGQLAPAKARGKNVSKASASLAQDSTTTGPGAESPTVESIALATYVCDFGNVVVGTPQKKSFRLTNCGRLPVQFQFKKEALQRANISIESVDKNTKIQPNCSTLFNVTFTTQTRRSKFGKMREIVPVEIKGGPLYEIEFRANLTQPELSMSSDNLDFGKVCVQTRKTRKIRFENNKEVPCRWHYNAKGDLSTGADVEQRFNITPLSGTLMPGQKQTVDVMFTPSTAGPVNQKMLFRCDDNQKQFALTLKGQGIHYQVDVLPEGLLHMGYVLPYAEGAVKSFELRNPMDQPIEVVSQDFDQKYPQEEEILRRLEHFSNPSPEPLFLPLRLPGQEFWPSLREQDEKRQRMEELKTQLDAIDEEMDALNKEEQALNEPPPEGEAADAPPAEGEEAPKRGLDEISARRNELTTLKGDLDAKMLEEKQAAIEVKATTAVKEHDRLNLVICGPGDSGETTLANYLAQEHQRKVIKFAGLYDWQLKRGNELTERCQTHLQERLAEFEAAVEAHKKKKPKKGEVIEEPKQADYEKLSPELVKEILSDRLSQDDCGAGVIFEHLKSDMLGNEKEAIQHITESVPIQNLQVLLLKIKKEEEAAEEGEAEEKKEEAQDASAELPVVEESKAEESIDRPAPQGRNQKPRRGAAKQSDKAVAPKDEEAAEKERKAKEEAERLKAEDEARALQTPKELSEEEVAAYEAFAEDFEVFFGELVMKQLKKSEAGDLGEDAPEGEEAKPAEPVAEEPPAEGEGEEGEKAEAAPEVVHGQRMLLPVPIEPNFKLLCDGVKNKVPEPIWPDPDKEPLPPPVIHQIVRKPGNRAERPAVKMYSIWTPLPEQEKEAPAEGEEPSQPAEGEEAEPENKEPAMTDTKTRWIIQPKESCTLYIKFFTEEVGDFPQTLNFEIVGSTRQFALNLKACCAMPSINTNYKNVFFNQKRTRPPTAPESYLEKTYVVSEGVFDFGPLLIGKDSTKRAEDESLQRINQSQIRITNSGQFNASAQFVLKSTLPVEEGGAGEPSPFILEPATMELDKDNTQNLTIWAFPEEARAYKDEIVCLLKDNPNPVIFPILALGAQPVVEVDQEVVEFDRLLLGKTLQKTLTLTNVAAIPANWRLTGVDELPEEFKVSVTSGRLAPCAVQTIEITFEAKEEKILDPIINLEVEDVEECGVKQEVKPIKLQAEAFKISPNVVVGKDDSQILDFGAVRVGEPKEQTVTIKNDGKYPIRYSFLRKKKLYREIFKVEPEEDELQPGVEKTIVVRLLTQKEIKLRTEKQQSELQLNILEGASQEINNEIPIHVNVNAVFSKYSITPLKNINFGPMQYGRTEPRRFEVRNEGLFEFKYAIVDFADQEAKDALKEERRKEVEERISGAAAEADDPKAKGKGKADPKAAKKGGKGEEDKGAVLNVGQYEISPATGSIPSGQSATVTVTFNADGAKFYESTLALDIADRDPTDHPDGIPFELSAESSIPGINTEDLDQIFEEQTVIQSLDPQLNTQTIISSSLYSQQERVFWFGTLVASKNPEGAKDRFKIMNPNKIPCKVNFAVKPRSQSKSEGFAGAFEVSPDSVSIDPHKHKYVTVSFNPTAMMAYGAIFEATVEDGDPSSPSGMLTFELRGEGTLPTLLVEKPDDLDADGTPMLKFRRTRIGRDCQMQIVLKNEGQVPATVRFDALQEGAFQFNGNMSHSITPKSYQAFDIQFKPKSAGDCKALLTFQTMGNPYEQHKVQLVGEGYAENVTFEGLPNDELNFGDCVVDKAKSESFQITNNGESPVKFSWSAGDKEGFYFSPSMGHLKPGAAKAIKVQFKSNISVSYEQIELMCNTEVIEYTDGEGEALKVIPHNEAKDWDDTMKTLRLVRPSELKRIMVERKIEEARRREEAEAAAAAAKGAKAPKKPAAGKETPAEELPEVDMSEEPTAELVETIEAPASRAVEGSEPLALNLKTSLVCDYGKYECVTTSMDFKPTLMYAQRTHKFNIKNTSLIALQFNFKITNPATGMLDAGPYSIFPKRGSIAPGCDDNFMVKFAPMEVEPHFERALEASFLHLDPAQEPLKIAVDGVAERPVIHFELPPSSYRERKEKDMTPVDSKFKIIEFDSLGTNIRNTRRFMAVNPTGQGYEFEWEEIMDENTKRNKPLFKCMTQAGLILSGKKSEMAFEYVPDTVGEHSAKFLFKIPKMNIQQHFLVVGRVNEPNVLFNSGRIKFGPLLLGGKMQQVVQLINQEHIPFSFSFAKETIKGGPDFGDSLRVNPVAGTVPAGSQIPVEVLFQPKYELNYNYNLTCNVKRKARPLVLNVKGEGYKIHHQVLAGSNRIEMAPGEPHQFDFGEFFINEKKTKTVKLVNKGEFNFDYVWRRQANRWIKVTPETGSVPKGEEVQFEINYLPQYEHDLKNYKMQLQIISGPKYDFTLIGKARKPGIKLSANTIDFGPCFVSRHPQPLKKVLVVENVDTSAISVETDFEKLPHFDVQLVPGKVLMPRTGADADQEHLLEIPVLFTPRDIQAYQETVVFDFNNLYTVSVNIKGEGIPLHLELKDPDQGFVDFGIISVGGDITKTVPIINKSKKPVTFRLKPADASGFNKCCLSCSPSGDITLKPREVLAVELRFNPKVRLPNFRHDLMLEVEGNEPRKLVTLAGVSHGIEIKLMDEVVAFGAVVRGSRLTKPLQMSNFGDVKAHFKWDSKIYRQNFTISPDEGYIAPNSNLDLEVTFHPPKSDLDLHYKKIPCAIKGGETLELSLMGKSAELDTSETSQLEFETKVRQANVQTVTVQNTDGREWAINPTISTELDSTKGFFKGQSKLVVPAGGSAQYEVTYQPTTMTKLVKRKKETEEENKDAEAEYEEVMDTHKGTLFFPLPNGTALLFKLQGTATEPDAEDEIQEKAVAKKVKQLMIPIKNWSRQSQRFKAKMTFAEEKDPAVFLSGASTFDVSGQMTKQYKLTFLSLKAGSYKFEVKFLNETTGEYAYNNVTMEVENSEDPIDTLELTTQVRESVAEVIPIENPTDLEVKIPASEFTFQHENIEISPAELVIPPRSERGFEILFRPLVAAEEETIDLTLVNAVLGTFKYNLKLKGLQPSINRSMAFKCALGAEVIQIFKFTHYLKKPTNYAVKVERVDNPSAQCDFKAEVAQVQAPAAESAKGIECQCTIRYEPYTIGDSRGVLKLLSPEGIEYSCMLYGKSIAPQPQGPIECLPGAKPSQVDFKNPLNEKQDFVVNFDNPNFSLASKPPQGVDPGKVTQLQIKFEAKPDLPQTGRMMVTAKGLPPWIFYLQGKQ